MSEKRPGRRTLQVERRIVGGPAPRPVTVRPTRLSDYPGVHQAHLDVASHLSSPLLGGPPVCDELIRLVQHLFTEEEASLARHLNGLRGKSAAEVARAARQPLDAVAPVLHRLAFHKFVIAATGAEGDRRYRLMPLMPGIFEMALMGEHLETMSEWHRRFAELFEALYETGYVAFSRGGPVASIRFLPVRDAVSTHPLALPSDKMAVVLDRYSSFAVGQCQCRLAMRVVGKGCSKPLSNCLAMGEFAEIIVRTGQGRRVTRKEAAEVKAEAEANGLVSWIFNVEGQAGQASCSCCGCCCHAMRGVNEFNVPALWAPPHFTPSFDRERCAYCGDCARTCPMGALVVDTRQRTAWRLPERCIGCGLCSLACSTRRAVSMEPVPDYRLPPGSWFALIAGAAPSFARNLATAFLSRSRLSSWWKG